MSAGQLSRSAAQAIRHLMREPSRIPDALYLINSLVASKNFSVRSSRPTAPQSSPPLIDFGLAVSPRLSAHCVLHALIRANRWKDASRASEWMMEQGIMVHFKTRELIILHLRSESPFSLPRSLHWRHGVSSSIQGSEVLTLGRGMVADQCTETAIQLVVKAHEYGHAHTKRTYETLIHWCLLQGEIIVGSLLFVLLVKHMQLRQAAIKAAMQAEHQRKEGRRQKDSVVEPIAWDRLEQSMKHGEAWPSSRMMKPIVDEIRRAFAEAPLQKDHANPSPLRPPLQSLANLAMLLDSGQLRQQHISSLVQALYSCPRMNEDVWILNRRGEPVQVKAYSYFHSVLKRLCNSFDGKSKSPPPQISRRSYNALLHYALRHRMSPALAAPILEHMCIRRDYPIQPNIVTCNILLRSAGLLRKQNISKPVIQLLKHFPGIQAALFEDPSDLPAPVEPKQIPPPPTFRSTFANALVKLQEQNLVIPEVFYEKPLAADMYTVTSFIKHLTSTGRPLSVANVLFILLPELGIVDHPTWTNSRSRKTQVVSTEAREQCLKRVTTYGPYFFAVVLEALVKAGRIGLAERVWRLAKQAERMSWDPEFVPGIKPWCLPVQAYTTMMQNYCNAARKKSPTDQGLEDSRWNPVSPDHVRGWAQFSLASRQLNAVHAGHPMGSRRLAQERGQLLFRSMLSGGKEIWKSLTAMQEQPPEVVQKFQLPRPDARFFNTALSLFGYHVYANHRRKRRERMRWRMRLWKAHGEYQHHGKLSMHWTPMLQEVVEHMVNAGYSVPLGYRQLFIGRWTPGTVYVGEPPSPTGVRPRAYPRIPDRNPRPHALSTVKTRGLPIGHPKHDAVVPPRPVQSM
ncbi:hypothetical protein OBBRIDRAFT_798167 [Obba rivulosa]|uniref:Pentatricopeptide repeat-containing protein n=1 Tax=Obba rivulosa TaxID=1052685 RepID=A0A8E2ANX3_9APHY|nr:hypothetical protein OBBRIDRAFT_798167 [Obba rivulosa]